MSRGLAADLRVPLSRFVLDARLTAGPGEVVALLGPNGAGKTTALRALAGLQPLSGGHVLLDGVRIDGLPPERRHVGLVPQDGALLPHLSARDNVAYGLRARGARRADAARRAEQELARVGLADRGAARPRALSGGQAQRVALARAVVAEPDVLFADEPTGSLDSLTGEQVMNLLVDAARTRGTTVVLVTHEPRVAAYADREVVVRDGRVTSLVAERADS